MVPVLVSGLLGLIVGSFLNVVVSRVPAGESLIRPGSRCPACGHPVRARHNVPVLGWVVLRGRCADCAAPIPVRYPALELGTGIVFAAVSAFLLHTGQPAAVPAYLYLAAAGLALTAIDLRHHRLPNAIVLPSYPVVAVLLVVASTVTGDWPALGRAALGGLSALALYGALWLVHPAGMGLGDVKLSGLLGLALAYQSWSVLLLGTFAAFVLGGVVGIAVLLTGRTRKTRIPFGPFMVAGLGLALLAGRPIVDAYLDLAFTA